MPQHPLFGEVSKNFNEAAALKAYDDFRSDPLYYHALLQMHAHDVVSEVKYLHPETVDMLTIEKFEQRKTILKDAILSGVVNKSMSNTRVDEIISTMDQIQKDYYTEFERAANVKGQRRDPRGRFVQMGQTKIVQPAAKHNRPNEWNQIAASYDTVTANRHNITNVPTLSGGRHEFNAKHSAAYLQVADALKNIDPGGLVMAEMSWERRDRSGNRVDRGTDVKVGSEVPDFVSPADYATGKVLTNIKWSMDMDSARGGGYDLLTGVGMDGGDYLTGRQMAGRAATGGGFDAEGNAVPLTGAMYTRSAAMQAAQASDRNEYGAPGNLGYSKLRNTAEMVDTIGGDALSGKAKWALGAAKYVGEHGPEAEKVLGPTARRTAYRYRGVERLPDAKLDRSIAASVQGARNVSEAREKLIHPSVSEHVAGSGGPDKQRLEKDVEFSPFVRYWQSQLPKRENLNLHLNSGAIAPSQGVVFDSKGQVVTQAVGYGDDHYLPFNLKNLSRSNRGEWVRTRTMGGPTTEDIYAALTTGTRSITVVSHSGVYNVEFDESFRGGRRYNDKSARMVRRYSQLLDTLEAENTTLQGVPSDRLAELTARANTMYPGESPAATEARQEYLKKLKTAEKTEPKPSKQRVDEWTAEFGGDVAEKMTEDYAERRDFPDEVDWDQLKAQQSIRAGRLLSDVEVIQNLGLETRYNKFLDYKTNEYRSQQQPLKLNGQGYYFALQALQEQFPYYIKRVEWYPPNEPQGGTDKGYVKQNFLRSANIKEGYWDPEIEGFKGTEKLNNSKGANQASGKVAANHMNFDNFAARQRVAGSIPPSPPATEPADTTNPADDQVPINPNRPSGGGGIFSQMAGSGVRMRPADREYGSLTPEAAAGIMNVAESIASLTVLNGGMDVPIGSSGIAELPRLTNWAQTEALLRNRDAEAERVLKELDVELKRVFSSTVEAGNVGAIGNTAKARLGGEYARTVSGSRLRVPANAVDAVSEANKNQMWNIGEAFAPGRSDDDYYRAQRDDDVVNFRDRVGQFGTEQNFRGSVSNADAAIRGFRNGTRTAGALYGKQTYYAGDADVFEKQVTNDVYGYLKIRQLSRLAGTAAPFEERITVPDTIAEAMPAAPKDNFVTTGEKERRNNAMLDRMSSERSASQALHMPAAEAVKLVGRPNPTLVAQGREFEARAEKERTVAAGAEAFLRDRERSGKINSMDQPDGWGG